VVVNLSMIFAAFVSAVTQTNWLGVRWDNDDGEKSLLRVFYSYHPLLD